jgi:hypothetical protein
MLTRLTRLAALIVLVVAMGSANSATAAPPGPPADNGVAALTTSFMQAVRIRKLHLVRPDLIPYPIQYDTLC